MLVVRCRPHGCVTASGMPCPWRRSHRSPLTSYPRRKVLPRRYAADDVLWEPLTLELLAESMDLGLRVWGEA